MKCKTLPALLSFVVALMLCHLETSVAQCSSAQCSSPEPQTNPMDACILPNPQALNCYSASTDFNASVVFPSWCGDNSNSQWYAFIADSTVATFIITIVYCSQGTGLQAAVFSSADCVNFTLTSNCQANMVAVDYTISATNLAVGEVYYLCVNGINGSVCSYSINFIGGWSSNGAVDFCLNASFDPYYATYSAYAEWTIEPPTAGEIIGPNIGEQVIVNWLEPGPAEVCASSQNCAVCIPVLIGGSAVEENVTLCEGYTVDCAGHTYAQPGSYLVTLPNGLLDCSNTVNCIVNLVPTVYTNETVYLCQNSSATCAGEEFFNPGTYPVRLDAYQGCDSIVNCHILSIPLIPPTNLQINLCGPAAYDVCNNSYNNSGLYTSTCTSWLGCDSIVNLNLAILQPNAVIAPPDTLNCGNNVFITLNGSGSSANTALNGATVYKWSGPGILGGNNLSTVQVNQPGTYCLIVTHSRGGVACSDTACVTVMATAAVPLQPQISGNPNPCGDSTMIYTAIPNGPSDSLTFHWTIPGNLSYTMLSPDTIQVTWDTVVSGQLCVTAANSCGASSAACLPVTVQAPILQPVLTSPASVCAGGGNYTFTLNVEQSGVNYTWTVPPGAVLTGAGDTVSINFLTAVSGQVCVTPQHACGTGLPVCQNVQVSPIPTADLSSDAQICAGESVNLNFSLSGNGPFDVGWTVGNQNFTLNNIVNGHVESVSPTQTTTYKVTSVSDHSAVACSAAVWDSVTVTVWQPSSSATAAQICAGSTYFVGGAAQTVSGIYTDSLNTVHGCDSIIVTTLTVNSIDTLVLSSTTCDPALAGTSTQTFLQSNGCDSVVISTVILSPTSNTQINAHSCDLNNVGVFTQNLSNIYGCDSTVVTTVTFALSDTTLVSATTCNPAQTGVFYNTLTTTDGCDSLIITTVEQLPIDLVLLTASSCNPSEVGVFPVVYTNQYGCDSTVVTTVSLLASSATALTGSSCNPSEVGTFTLPALVNQFGCDSILTLTVSFAPLAPTFETATTCDAASAGIFTNTYITSGGCDSVVTRTVDLLSSSTTALTGSSCNPFEVGIFTLPTLVNQFGCDSVITLTVSFTPLAPTFETATTCDAASAGIFTSTYITSGGCDSVVTRTVTLLPSNTTALQTTTCDPALAGVFTYPPLVNQYGCDSIVTETRVLLPGNLTPVNLTTCDAAQVGTQRDTLSNQWGCDSIVVTVTTQLPSNSCAVSATLVGSTIPCAANTGSLTLTLTVGTAPFDYTVTQGATTVTSGTVTTLGAPQPITGLPAGNYTVTISSPNGFSTTAQATIVQLVPPALSSSANSDYTGFDVSCAGATDGTALASATGGQPPYAYAWSTGGTTQQVGNLAAGVYTVTVVDGNGCTNVSTVALLEPTPLVIGFTVNDLDCFGNNDGAIQVETNGGAPPYAYTLNSSPAQASNIFFGLDAGTYTITTTDANDCQQTEAIVVDAAVPVNVDLGDDINIDLGESTTIHAIVNVSPDSIASLVWTPPFDVSECPECPDQVVTPFVSTVYSVRVEALNGCTDEDEITVIVDRRKQIYVPNVFSPNDDGSNDMFGIYAKPGSVRKILAFQVYDRWGEALFSLEDFLPTLPPLGWDGSYKGSPMNPGVFVWVAEIEFVDGERELFKGDVTIVR